MKILYIDDDADDVYIFSDAIEKVDPAIECDFAHNAQDALFKLKSQRLPDMIFLDINMPEMNGKQFLESIKSNPLLRHIPIVMYSTSDSPRELLECRNLGASAYIVKASNFQKICEQLQQIIHQIRCNESL